VKAVRWYSSSARSRRLSSSSTANSGNAVPNYQACPVSWRHKPSSPRQTRSRKPPSARLEPSQPTHDGAFEWHHANVTVYYCTSMCLQCACHLRHTCYQHLCSPVFPSRDGVYTATNIPTILSKSLIRGVMQALVTRSQGYAKLGTKCLGNATPTEQPLSNIKVLQSADNTGAKEARTASPLRYLV